MSEGSRGRRARSRAAWAAVVAVLAAGAVRGEDAAGPERLRAIRAQIAELRSTFDSLSRSERGLVGELDRLSASLRLRQAEAEEVRIRVEEVEREVAEREARLRGIAAARNRRAAYLRFRVREMYKRGPAGGIARWFDETPDRSAVSAFRYAVFLNERDAKALAEWREAGRHLEAETAALEEERARLLAVERENDRARWSLDAARRERAARLDAVRGDRARHGTAIVELEAAAAALEELARRGGGGEAPSLDVGAFRGLLDPPIDAKVSAGFGNRVHPRFRTVVPHPGWDIEAAEGEPFRSVFDGTVAYAAWLRGYGLTVLVDHGGGVVSVYAHAASLWVETGEAVSRGQVLGTVGDTGSLRGAFLYFEVRESGRPVDPALWIRRR